MFCLIAASCGGAYESWRPPIRVDDLAATPAGIPTQPSRLPFAQGTADGFGGEFAVPSYRGSSFLDPKGRGASTGYDNAVALPAAADDGAWGAQGGVGGGSAGAISLARPWHLPSLTAYP